MIINDPLKTMGPINGQNRDGITIAILSLFTIVTVNAVTYPPSFVQMPPREAVYQIKEAIKLPCVANGEPPPTYEWIKNGYLFNVGANDKRYTKWPGEGTLIFAIPEADDDGMYWCIARNQYGAAYSMVTNMRRAQINQFPSRPEQVVNLKPGDSIRFMCGIPNSFPEPLVRWMIEKDGATRYIKETNRRAVDNDGNLVIAMVDRYEDNNARYYCTAYNERLRKQNDDVRYYLKVQQIANSKKDVALMFFTPKPIVAIEKEKMDMRCIFTGSPLPRIRWEKVFPDGTSLDVNEMPNVDIMNTGTLLRIEPVTKESVGTYRCIGYNEVSEKTVYNDFEVSIQSRPSFIKQPVDTTVELGGSHIFECTGIGVPVPQIKWKVNGDDPAKYLNGINKRLENNRIILEDLKPADDAVFQCNVSNSNGYAFTNAYINVMQEKPSFIKAPQKNYRVAEGQTARIFCQTFSAPKALTTWTFNGNPISGGRFILESNGDITIRSVSPTDTGVFECLAQNKYGSITGKGNIIVRQRTRMVIKPIDTWVYEKSEVKFVCTATTDPLEADNLQIVWYKDHTILDYDVNERVRTNPFDNSLIISGSQPRDTGQYTCSATNGLDSDNYTASLVVQGVPSIPLNQEVDCITNRNKKIATLKWEPGTDNYAPIIRYIIEFSMGNREPNTWYPAELEDGTDTVVDTISANIKMRPDIQYRFRVKAQNRVGISEPSYYTTTQCYILPEVPYTNPRELFVYGDKPNNLIIRWTRMPLVEHNGGSFAYHITTTCLNCRNVKKEEMNNTQISDWRVESVTYEHFRVGTVVYQIEPYRQFQVVMKVKNVEGESSAPALVRIGYSGETVPSIAPPLAPEIISMDSNKIILQWDILTNDSVPELNGFFRGYRIEWCLDSLDAEQCEKYKRYQDALLQKTPLPVIFGKKKRRRKRSVGEQVQENLSFSRRRRFVLPIQSQMQTAALMGSTMGQEKIDYGGKMRATLISVPGKTKIRIWLRILNNQYVSPPSPAVVVTTPEGTSGPVSELRLLSTAVNSIIIQWRKPGQTNGDLTGYQIGARELNGLDLGYLTPYPPITNPDLLQGDVSGLKPDTSYRIYIWPRTVRGNGVDNFIDIRTAPANIAPSAPSFAIAALEPKTLNVTFTPSQTGVTGSVFYAEYRLPGLAFWQETKREYIERYVVITGLQEGTLYEVRMVATNGAAMTAFTKSMYARTLGDVRNQPLVGASATWFIILFFLVLIIIVLVIALVYLRKRRLEAIRGKPLLEPDRNPAESYIPESVPPMAHTTSVNNYQTDVPPSTDYFPEDGDNYYPEDHPADDVDYFPEDEGENHDEVPSYARPGTRSNPMYQNVPQGGPGAVTMSPGGSVTGYPTSSTVI